MKKQRVVIAIGANIGEPLQQIEMALGELSCFIYSLQISPFYQTRPIGYLHQPDFINGVVLGKTTLAPDALMHAMNDIEKELGRKRRIKNGPRPMDLDLILYGNRIQKQGAPILPHPRFHRRDFVLKPLNDLQGNLRHPILGKTVAQLLHALPAGDRSII